MIMFKMVFGYQNSQKALFLYEQQDSSKAKVAQFRVFEVTMEGPHSHCYLSPTAAFKNL
jgi:hypothetical protein